MLLISNLRYLRPSSFLTGTTLYHSGVFLKITSKPILTTFHMYVTNTYTKECSHLLMQHALLILSNKKMKSKNFD